MTRIVARVHREKGLAKGIAGINTYRMIRCAKNIC